MPRFFFDVIYGEQRIDDVEGQELPDLESARLAAARAAREIGAHDLMREEPLPDPVVEIRGADGNLIELFRPSAGA
jgi:hypothetical protein